MPTQSKTEMKKQRKMLFLKTLWVLSIISLVGCGTVAPKPLKDVAPSFDESTPTSLNPNTSGFLGYIVNERNETIGAEITKGRVDLYNALIEDYRLQYREATGHSINQGDGIESRGIKDGKEIFFIDARHLAIFFKLNRWKKEGREKDGVWMRLKDKMLQ